MIGPSDCQKYKKDHPKLLWHLGIKKSRQGGEWGMWIARAVQGHQSKEDFQVEFRMNPEAAYWVLVTWQALRAAGELEGEEASVWKTEEQSCCPWEPAHSMLATAAMCQGSSHLNTQAPPGELGYVVVITSCHQVPWYYFFISQWAVCKVCSWKENKRCFRKTCSNTWCLALSKWSCRLVHWLRARAVLAESLRWAASTLSGWLTTISNSSFRGSTSFF